MDDAKYQRALQLLNRNNLKAALPLLQEVVAQKPDSPEPYRHLAQVYMMDGNFNKAIDICLEALVIDPENENANLVMGNIFLHKEDWLSAEKYFMNVLSTNPDSIQALNNLAAINIKMGNPEVAINCFDSVIALAPDYLNAYYGKASILMELGKLREMFDILVDGLLKYVPRPENPLIYPETIKALYGVAGDLASQIDVDALVDRVKHEIETKWNVEIRIEPDANLKVSAQMQYGPTHNRPYHRVVYNPSKPFYGHLVMHEFMHLIMALEAGTDRNYIIYSTPNEDAEFRKKMAPQMQKLHKNISPRQINESLDNIHMGMVLQSMNCPLDLLVEDRLYTEYPELRPLQFLSLWQQEQENIESVNKPEMAKVFPKDILEPSRIMNITTAKHFKELYGVVTIEDYKASRQDRKAADDLYEIYREYKDDREPGEEFDMMLDFTDALGQTIFMKIEKESDFVANRARYRTQSASTGASDEELERRRYEDLDPEQAERQRLFDENQRKENPMRDMMMAMYMQCALEEFENWSSAQINRVALEIAMRGTRGINPTDDHGYSVPSFPGRDFNGSEFLAYYYVSWKIAHPEDLKAIGLQVYDRAYLLAKKRYDQKKGQ